VSTAPHTFLSGEVGIGKSTALSRFLADNNASFDGFATFFDRRNSDRTLYFARASSDLPRDEWEREIAVLFTDSRINIHTETFDSFGVDTLNLCEKSLIVMDELGTFEQSSYAFTEKVLQMLDGEAPIVGVVKLRDAPFLDAVRRHPRVEVLHVTRDNRDEIPAILREKYAIYLK
jgi:nucleoside-triphosphatase